MTILFPLISDVIICQSEGLKKLNNIIVILKVLTFDFNLFKKLFFWSNFEKKLSLFKTKAFIEDYCNIKVQIQSSSNAVSNKKIVYLYFFNSEATIILRCRTNSLPE